jgi:hypothetical protein
MERLSKTEGDACLLDNCGNVRGMQRQIDAKGLEDVGRTR